MITCSCGASLQPTQKFCPNCGRQVTADHQQPTLYPQMTGTPTASGPVTAGITRCSHCGGEVNANAPFCMHCGTPLSAASAQPAQASAPTNCPSCGTPVNAGVPFCAMCGAHLTGLAAAAPAVLACPNCGQATNGNAPFCMHCGARLQGVGTPAGAAQARQTTCAQCGFPLQAGAAFCTHCGAHYGPPLQPGMQPGMQPMMGMQQQVMRCPTCMGAVPAGTSFCQQCGTSMNGVQVPAGVQGQPQGFFQNLMGSNAGKIGVGVAGGLAAAFVGEELLHGIERGAANDMEYDEYGNPFRRRREGGGLMGEIIRDVL